MSSSSTPVHALLLRVMHDRLARGEHALRIRIARRARQIADHVLNDFVRRLETERRQIADVQLDDAVAFFFETLRGGGVFEDFCTKMARTAPSRPSSTAMATPSNSG